MYLHVPEQSMIHVLYRVRVLVLMPLSNISRILWRQFYWFEETGVLGENH
jgi:hypothetical protein